MSSTPASSPARRRASDWAGRPGRRVAIGGRDAVEPFCGDRDDRLDVNRSTASRPPVRIEREAGLDVLCPGIDMATIAGRRFLVLLVTVWVVTLTTASRA